MAAAATWAYQGGRRQISIKTNMTNNKGCCRNKWPIGIENTEPDESVKGRMCQDLHIYIVGGLSERLLK